MTIPASGYFYPNNMARFIFEEAQAHLGSDQYVDIMRRAGLDHYLTAPPPLDYEKAVDMAQIAAFAAAIDELPRTGGWPQSYHVSRRTFKRGMDEFGTLGGVGGKLMSIKAMPVMLRMKIGVHLMAAVFNTITDQVNEIREREHYFDYLITHCPACMGRKAEHPICEMTIGLLSEGLFWALGRPVGITETTCIAMGHAACTLSIAKFSIIDGPMQPPPKTS